MYYHGLLITFAHRVVRSFGVCCPSWHPWHGHSLLQGCPGRRGVFRVLARVSGIGGECFSWMGRGSSAVTRLLLI